MADMSWQSHTQSKAESAVLDMDLEEMEMMDDGHSSDVSDYDNSFRDDGPPGGGSADGKGKKSMVDDLRQRMGENMTQMVWQAGTQGAKRAWTLYGNIDVLRPYFDVEPKEVQMRLLYSLVPIKPTDQRQRVPKELYGPTMVVLTLIALLLYQMKTAEHKVEEGTLMGSAFGVCFMYWLGASCLVWFVTYVCNVRITILQILSMMGYALFGHCIALFFGTVIHTSHDHMFFYLLWAIIGGLSTLKMAGIVMSRTRGRTERLIVISTIAALHLLFLLYLHFAYHTIVEELSDTFHENLVPVPAAQQDTNGLEETQQAQSKEAFQHATDAKLLDTVMKVKEDIMPSVVKDHTLGIKPVLNGTGIQLDSGVAKLPEIKPKPDSILLAKLKNTGVITA